MSSVSNLSFLNSITSSFNFISLLFMIEFVVLNSQERNTIYSCCFYYPKSYQTEEELIEFIKTWTYQKYKIGSLYLSYDFWSRPISKCSSCSKNIFFLEKFDECYKCHRLLCNTCFDDIKQCKYIFGSKKHQLKKCKLCSSNILTVRSQLNDFFYNFE